MWAYMYIYIFTCTCLMREIFIKIISQNFDNEEYRQKFKEIAQLFYYFITLSRLECLCNIVFISILNIFNVVERHTNTSRRKQKTVNREGGYFWFRKYRVISNEYK